jgi:hypothetical protein
MCFNEMDDGGRGALMIAQAERSEEMKQRTPQSSTGHTSTEQTIAFIPLRAQAGAASNLWSIIGIMGIAAGVLLSVSLLLSMPAQGKTLQTAAPALLVQQQRSVNGRSVYAAPIVTGPAATAVLQNIPANGIAYVVHTFAARGKLVSTANSWFRCVDIVSASQYNGSQVEIESWTLLTEQERLEAQAACSF